MRGLVVVVSVLHLAVFGALPAQQITPGFARWEAASPSADAGPAGSLETLRLQRRDYRYEGLAFGGIVLGAAGAYVGWNLSSPCPTVPGAQCNSGRFGNAVAAGVAGAALGGGLGYLVGRLTSKPDPDHLPPIGLVLPSLIPDSTRIPVGYQHWKGAAVGAGSGAVFGTLLALATGSGCSDCQTTASDYVRAIGITTALGGTLGFLIGLASPKYQ